MYSEFIFISYGYVAFHENSYMTKGEDHALQSSVLDSFMKGSAINVYVVDVEKAINTTYIISDDRSSNSMELTYVSDTTYSSAFKNLRMHFLSNFFSSAN